MSADIHELDRLIAILESADAQIDREAARRFVQALDQLRAYAALIGHKQSGAMTASMYRLGPFPVGQGSMEGIVDSGAFYAPFEAKRGGSHDWPNRTLDERQALLDRLAEETGMIVLQALGLRGS